MTFLFRDRKMTTIVGVFGEEKMCNNLAYSGHLLPEVEN